MPKPPKEQLHRGKCTMTLRKCFIASAGVILLVTGMAKIAAAAGAPRILLTADPVFIIPLRYVLIMASVLELCVAFICLTNAAHKANLALIAWLSTAILVYRLGRIWVGYRRPCMCMGTVTASLHISPATADLIMRVVLAYLIFGSYSLIMWRFIGQRYVTSLT